MVEIGPASYLAIDSRGAPGDMPFQDAIGALYGVAYTLKFIAKMGAFAAEEGLVPHGRHHEIYLSDPRRAPAERLKTVLRQPVKPASRRKA